MQLDALIIGGLRCFEMTGRLRSFTKAAQALNLSQSAVSQQIRQLEERLGYPLFVRQHGGLTLTANGQALFDTTSKALSEIAHTLAHPGPSMGPLQVNCLPSFALQWLMPRMTEFYRLHPQHAVRLKAEFQSLDRQGMNAANIDVAVRYDPLDYRHLHAEVLMDEFLVAVASPHYLDRHPLFASGDSLAGVTLLHDAAPWENAPEYIEWRTWANAVKPAWIDRLDGPQFNLASLAIGAALSGQGVAMGRLALVADDLESGRLVDVFKRTVPAPARYMLLTRNPDDARVAVFSDWLKLACAAFGEARDELMNAARP